MIADRVAARVVDLLELIEIDRRDGDRGPAAARLAKVRA